MTHRALVCPPAMHSSPAKSLAAPSIQGLPAPAGRQPATTRFRQSYTTRTTRLLTSPCYHLVRTWHSLPPQGHGCQVGHRSLAQVVGLFGSAGGAGPRGLRAPAGPAPEPRQREAGQHERERREAVPRDGGGGGRV